jgi:hypothetical protein
MFDSEVFFVKMCKNIKKTIEIVVSAMKCYICNRKTGHVSLSLEGCQVVMEQLLNCHRAIGARVQSLSLRLFFILKR